MMELYRGRAAGGTTADVTRRASQHILAQRRKAKVTTHPFFWGAFVATGDWR
jgi:CHAT domain-containing protein